MFSMTITFLFGSLLGTIFCQTYEDVLNLRTTLLASYNADILPLDDQNSSLNINLTMVVFTMPDVDPVHGAITMGIMVTQEWYDERLTWTPADHNGTTTISIKSEYVWTPPLTVANPVKFTLLDSSWMQVMVMTDGKMSYTVGGMIKFSCSFYMKFWPFDKQSCSLNLFPYGYSANKVTFTVPGTVVDTGIYTENGEWFLDEKSFEYEIDTVFGMSRVAYSFKIARLSSFYILTVIIPINGIGALTCLVFLLPSESGERVGYSITIMLSLAVFLTMTAENLPKNGSPIPIVCVYILFNMIACICGLILVILNLKLYYRPKDVPIAKFYKSIVKFSRCRCRRREVHDDARGKNEPLAKSRVIVNSKHIFVSESEDAKLDDNIEWKDVGDAIDQLLFYAMVIVTYIPSIIILIYTANASDYVTMS